jgi:hypothetical protein
MSPRVIRTSSGRLLAAALAVPVVFSSPFGIGAADQESDRGAESPSVAVNYAPIRGLRASAAGHRVVLRRSPDPASPPSHCRRLTNYSDHSGFDESGGLVFGCDRRTLRAAKEAVLGNDARHRRDER